MDDNSTTKPDASGASPCSLPSQFKGRFVGYGMGKIFVKTPKGETTALDVRGWGYLTGKGDCALGMSEDDACKVQDQFEAWVIEALNHYAENNRGIM